ncbi:MAG: hypothetical protein QNJ40_15405 [Xanthomonadales bacterium]|nr:hypothetical protein [Xanthomonadales bacterium]
MNDTSEYQHSDLYFRVTYADVGMKYPLIESFVFVGKNIGCDDHSDTWYFQPARSFAMYGSVLSTDSGDRMVVAADEKEAEEMLDVRGLMVELQNAAQRRM